MHSKEAAAATLRILAFHAAPERQPSQEALAASKPMRLFPDQPAPLIRGVGLLQATQHAASSAVWCGVVRRGAVWCRVVRCGAVRCGAVPCGAVRCGAVRCGTAALQQSRGSGGRHEPSLILSNSCCPDAPVRVFCRCFAMHGGAVRCLPGKPNLSLIECCLPPSPGDG